MRCPLPVCPLRRRCRTKAFSSGIGFGNPDVAILCPNFHANIAAVADRHVDVVVRLGPALLFFEEIVGDFPSRRFGLKMKRGLAWNKRPDITARHRPIDDEVRSLPPIKREVDIAGSQIQREIAEAVPGKQEAAAQPRLYLTAA